MCDPIVMAVVSVGVSALSAGVKYAGDETAANTQEVYQEELYEENERKRKQNQENTLASYEEEIATENLITRQQVSATSQDNLSLIKEGLRATGLAQAKTMGGGNGASQVVIDLERQEATYQHTAHRNLMAKMVQTKQRKKSARVRAINSINSVTPYIPAPVQHPSALAAILPVAGAALGAADTYYNRSVR